MNKTFYVPESKRKLTEEFAEICEKEGKSYSTVLVEYMESVVKNPKILKKS